MMKKVGGVNLFCLLLLCIQLAAGNGISRPGKPTLTRCRSPEKETFTCWWEPGPEFGLKTTYALYYRKENSEMVYECPDYKTAGVNSCFFSKNDTSIWVNYNITVVATNEYGKTSSDPVDIDVVYIVMPNPPENVTASVMADKDWPFLRVSWEPPKKADTRSGWITLIYEVRIKMENEADWEVHHAGQQRIFKIFSLRSGGKYHIQVRCKPDHGFWSEWSPSVDVTVPECKTFTHRSAHKMYSVNCLQKIKSTHSMLHLCNNLPVLRLTLFLSDLREKSMWIIFVVFLPFFIFIITWLMYLNIHSLKYCLLPPVPGPKIKGFDKQLLKNGKSGDIFSALGVSDFPPTTSSYENFLEEYLEVYVPEERELIMEGSKDPQDDSVKSENSTCDNDSGRGSCDSHTLLIDKGGGDKEDELQSDQEGGQAETDAKSHEEASEDENVHSPDISNEKVKIWPSLCSPLPQYSLCLVNQPNPPEMRKHCLSDSMSTPDSLPSYFTQPGSSAKNDFRSNYWESNFNHKPSHPLHTQTTAHEHLLAQSDISTACIDRTGAPSGVHVPSVRPNEYVEVQRVSDENMVLLHPVSSGQENSFTVRRQTEDYSRVRTLNNGNGLLLLQRETMEQEMDMCPNEEEAEGSTTSTGNTAPITPVSQKSMAGISTALPILDERAASGYVDTATMFGLSTY
ncbi:prolactin receptor a [Fundulus diaphanus]